MKTANENARQIFLALEQAATSITSHALHTNQQWPFVTVEDFELRMQDTRALGAKTGTITLNTFIQEKDAAAWANYSRANFQRWNIESQLASPEFDKVD